MIGADIITGDGAIIPASMMGAASMIGADSIMPEPTTGADPQHGDATGAGAASQHGVGAGSGAQQVGAGAGQHEGAGAQQSPPLRFFNLPSSPPPHFLNSPPASAVCENERATTVMATKPPDRIRFTSFSTRIRFLVAIRVRFPTKGRSPLAPDDAEAPLGTPPTTPSHANEKINALRKL